MFRPQSVTVALTAVTGAFLGLFTPVIDQAAQIFVLIVGTALALVALAFSALLAAP